MVGRYAHYVTVIIGARRDLSIKMVLAEIFRPRLAPAHLKINYDQVKLERDGIRMQHVTKKMAMYALLACLTCSLRTLGQDFQKTYDLAAGGRISVRNVSGEVTVIGYDGQDLLVTGYKEGRDRDLVTIEEELTGSNLSIRASYPSNCNCRASVRLEVKVPRTKNYRFNAITSISGNVEVSEVDGEINAKSVSGNVVVRNVTGSVEATSTSGNVIVQEIKGAVSAKSISGNVDVTILQLSTDREMAFSSVSGNVKVKLPANLDAQVKMSTLSGNLETDFGLTIEESRFSPGRRASGRVGGGSHHLKVTSISGNVSLLRR